MMQNSVKFQQVEEEKCSPVTRQVCRPTTRQVCKPVAREVCQQVPPAPQCQLFRRATCLMKEDNVCGSADFHFSRFWRGGEGHMNATQFNL